MMELDSIRVIHKQIPRYTMSWAYGEGEKNLRIFLICCVAYAPPWASQSTTNWDVHHSPGEGDIRAASRLDHDVYHGIR